MGTTIACGLLLAACAGALLSIARSLDVDDRDGKEGP